MNMSEHKRVYSFYCPHFAVSRISYFILRPVSYVLSEADYSSTTASPSSSSCAASAGVGASVMRQDASLIFGNAITSRMLSCFAMSMTRRSRPYASTCVRRHSVLERLEQEAKLAVSLLLRKSKRLEHLLLDVVLMDSDASAANLISVEYDIVSLGADAAKFPFIKKRQSSSMGIVNG